MPPSVLILRAAGTNCDAETAHAFELAGAAPVTLHINRLIENPSLLAEHQILAIPGGFSYGDDISAGVIFASQLMQKLHDPLHRFVESGRPVIGICNGFQILIKTDLLPGGNSFQSSHPATLTNNESHEFKDTWIHLKPAGKTCLWTTGTDKSFELPIAHGEGRFVPASDGVLAALKEKGQIALTYCQPDGQPANGQLPHNPNGATADIAGICDPTGLVLGLMPHPERHVSRYQHYAWTSRQDAEEGPGMKIFRNGVAIVK